MLLNPGIFNNNAYLASEVLGIPRSTLLGWISMSVKNNKVPKWYDIVANLSWGDVKRRFDDKICAEFKDVEDEEKVDLSKYQPLRGENVVLSAFCGIPASKRAKLARRSLASVARGQVSKIGRFSIVNQVDKRQEGSRIGKFAKMERYITDFVLQGWHSGSPVTRQGCYMVARKISKKEDMFWKQYLDPSKKFAQTQLSHWLSRLLSRIGFSSRKETVSLTIPDK